MLISVAAVDGSFADEVLESLAPSFEARRVDRDCRANGDGRGASALPARPDVDGLEGALLASAVQFFAIIADFLRFAVGLREPPCAEPPDAELLPSLAAVAHRAKAAGL